MKRGGTLKRTPLKRHGGLRARRKLAPPVEPGRYEWKIARAGWCECGCGRFSLHLHRHHVVTETVVRREGGDPWAFANSMLLHPDCHMNHHAAFRRIPLPMVPAAAIDFAVRLLGQDRGLLYMARFYAPERDGGRWEP